MEERLKSGARRFCQGAFSFLPVAPRAKSALWRRGLMRQLFFVEAAMSRALRVFLDPIAEFIEPSLQTRAERRQFHAAGLLSDGKHPVRSLLGPHVKSHEFSQDADLCAEVRLRGITSFNFVGQPCHHIVLDESFVVQFLVRGDLQKCRVKEFLFYGGMHSERTTDLRYQVLSGVNVARP
jgi:hypothetical protein